MFIKLGEYVIAINQIAFIKRIGAGCEVCLKDSNFICAPKISAGASNKINVTNEALNTLKIATVTDEEYNRIKWKLCGITWQPEDALRNVADKVAKEEEDNIQSLKLCNREKCKGCEYFDWIPVDVSPIIRDEENAIWGWYTCDMMNKKVKNPFGSSFGYALISPKMFFESDDIFKEEK